MNCPRHGELNPDWTSCPFCIRERMDPGGGRGAPPAPSFEAMGGAPATRGAGPAAFGPPPGGAGVTRGAEGAGAWQSPRQPASDVTRGAESLGFSGLGSSGKTRIIDAPRTTRRIRAWLIQKDGPRPDQIYQVKDTDTWIGRDRRNDVFLDEDTVSSQHAKLWVDDKRVLRLLNVSTANGTFVNGVRVEAPVELKENDEIKVGTAVLVLKRIDAPIRDEPAAHDERTPAMDPRPGSTQP
jgi:FHA domain